jgi:chorismate mutase
MINRKYWRHDFLEAISQNNQQLIKYLLENNCQIDSDIFTAILRLPNLGPEILDLTIKAAHNFQSYHLQQVMTLFATNNKAILTSIETTKNIEGHLLEALSKLDYIDIAIGQNILRKLVSYDQSRLAQVLKFAQNDQDLINLAISKINILLPHNLQEIFAIQDMTAENLKLAIAKAKEIQEWNLTDLLDLKPSPEIIFSALVKTEKLFGWHLQKLSAQGYNQLSTLKLCVSKIDKLEAWNLKGLLKVANLDGQLIRLILDRIEFIDDITLIKSALEKTDFIRLGNIKLLLKNGIFDDVRELALAKLQTKLSSNELEAYITQHIACKPTEEEYPLAEYSLQSHQDTTLSGEE